MAADGKNIRLGELTYFCYEAIQVSETNPYAKARYELTEEQILKSPMTKLSRAAISSVS